MSTALLRCSPGDLPILGGSMRLATGRPWSAVVDVHAEAELAELSPASIVLTREDGTEDVFVGAVRKSALNDGRAQLSVTVVGGRGLIARTIGPRDYDKGATEVPVGLIVAGIMADAGELLADGVVAALDQITVPHWHRIEGPASDALDLLVSVLGTKAPGLAWRVLPSGRVWAGIETWPAGPDLRRLGYELEDGGRRYGPDGGQILPGQLLEGRRVVDVVYQLGGPLRATARADVAGDPAHQPDVELYRRTWAARVVSQDAAGLLELVPDDPRMGDQSNPLRGVPLRCGIPGARITYQAPAGERVRLAFEAADPRLPYAEACDQTGATVYGVAREGDPVGYLSGTAPPGGGPVVLSISPIATGAPGEVALSILSGSPEVQIR